jgi:hypothetical protein
MVVKMNLSQLYSQLLNVLAENSTPQYWSESELKSYLNRGLIEFVKRTRFLRKNVYLDKCDIEDGAYFLPTDIIEPEGVQFQGKPLDKKNIKFLESAYSGTSHQRYLSGIGYLFGESWRNMIGDPAHWFFENQFVKIFPKPSFELTGTASGSLIQTISATFYAGLNVVQLPLSLPYVNKNLIDVYVNGNYQNIADWDINPSDSSQIIFTYTAPVNMNVEVVYQNSAVVASKYTLPVSLGQSVFLFSNCPYNAGTDSIRAVMNSVNLTGSDFSVFVPGANQLQLTLNAPAVAAGFIEITVYTTLLTGSGSEITPNRVADNNVTMDYIYLPASLVDSSDEPEIPTVFHDACWQWAAFLALSKEGAKTQDVKKAGIYLTQFEETIFPAKSFTETEIDIEPAVQMPWML